MVWLAEKVLDVTNSAVVLAVGLVQGHAAPGARLELGGAVVLEHAGALALHQHAPAHVAAPSLVLQEEEKVVR